MSTVLCAHNLPGSCPDCFYGPAKLVVHRTATEVRDYWTNLSGVDLAGMLIPGLTAREVADVTDWQARRELGAS